AVEEATEEPVAVTEAVEEATEEPVAVTEAVEEATEEPVAVTEAVEEATEEPVAVTEAVEEATEEPVAVTEAVEEATEGHIAADEAIKEGAEGPIAVLDEPVTESDTTAVVPADELEAVAAPEPIKDGSEGPIPVLDEPAFKASEEPVAVEPVEEPAASAPVTEARTMGELFGEPDKEHWSPSEIVTACCRLPQFAGALVSLHEGLVVAESLPDSMRGEDVAAFLPQMFTRLNQYSDEMKLGTLDDLLMRTNGAEFQVFRLAMVFFAVLGKPGHNLPRRELELIAEELARQTQK
ncbi:MAG: hypothetical protein V4710_24465, partial [Verrucomicrobiota bacterium]